MTLHNNLSGMLLEFNSIPVVLICFRMATNVHAWIRWSYRLNYCINNYFALQCLQCQRVFDKSQAIEQPSDSPEFLRSSTSYRGPAISQLMCPHCHSQILQQSMPRCSTVTCTFSNS